MIITSVARRAGMNPAELKRFSKFFIVGLIGAVIDFGVYNLLIGPMGRAMASDWAATISGTISFILAIISNFLWNRYWTYPDSRSKSLRRQFAQFFTVNFAAVIIRIPILYFATSRFIALLSQFDLSDNVTNRLGKNLALAVAVGMVMFWNFFVNRYWTYSDVKK